MCDIGQTSVFTERRRTAPEGEQQPTRRRIAPHWIDGLGFRGQSEAFFRRYADVATAWEACPKATWALALAYRLGLAAGAPEFRAIATEIASAAGVEAAPGGEWGAWGSAYDTCIQAARASESFDDSIAASTDVVRRHIPTAVIADAFGRIGGAK